MLTSERGKKGFCLQRADDSRQMGRSKSPLFPSIAHFPSSPPYWRSLEI